LGLVWPSPFLASLSAARMNFSSRPVVIALRDQ
jgi:hypothetical protein